MEKDCTHILQYLFNFSEGFPSIKKDVNMVLQRFPLSLMEGRQTGFILNVKCFKAWVNVRIAKSLIDECGNSM